MTTANAIMLITCFLIVFVLAVFMAYSLGTPRREKDTEKIKDLTLTLDNCLECFNRINDEWHIAADYLKTSKKDDLFKILCDWQDEARKQIKEIRRSKCIL